MSNIGITGTGFYVPSKVMTNKDLESLVDTSDEWIQKKVGIKERRIASPQEATSDLAIYAAQEALSNANVENKEIDLIILATSTPDMIQPATASIVQGKIGATNSAAFDVSAVCAGFIYAITTAYGMMKGIDHYKKALVIGAETYSRILDWNDRETCVFFGDGAGAVILEEVEDDFGIQETYLKNDGRGASVIQFLAGGSRYPASEETLEKNMHKFEMQGKQVWDFATTVMPLAVNKVVESADEKVSNLDFVIPHQANINIIKNSMDKLNLPMSKTYTNIDKYGNTSGASVAIALAEAHQKGVFNKGDKISLVGFGGGLSYGAVYLTWGI
jgi:3-oxoacyl-[acyl-carrier-protein] synthase-3